MKLEVESDRRPARPRCSRRRYHHGPMVSVVLYSRPGCGLCDEARAVIVAERVAHAVRFAEVDVSTDDALELEYGIRIPVVLVDGRELFEIRVDPQGVRRCGPVLRRAACGLRLQSLRIRERGTPTRYLTRVSERPIPEATVGRLPVYLRTLVEMAENGATMVSSEIAGGGDRRELGQGSQGSFAPRLLRHAWGRLRRGLPDPPGAPGARSDAGLADRDRRDREPRARPRELPRVRGARVPHRGARRQRSGEGRDEGGRPAHPPDRGARRTSCGSIEPRSA